MKQFRRKIVEDNQINLYANENIWKGEIGATVLILLLTV